MKFDNLLPLTFIVCNENDLVSWMVQLLIPKFKKRLNVKLTEVNRNPPNDLRLCCPLETKEQCLGRALLLQAFFPPRQKPGKAAGISTWSERHVPHLLRINTAAHHNLGKLPNLRGICCMCAMSNKSQWYVHWKSLQLETEKILLFYLYLWTCISVFEYNLQTREPPMAGQFTSEYKVAETAEWASLLRPAVNSTWKIFCNAAYQEQMVTSIIAFHGFHTSSHCICQASGKKRSFQFFFLISSSFQVFWDPLPQTVLHLSPKKHLNC